MSAAVVQSVCSAMFLTNTGDGMKWLPVTGRITKGSMKVIASEGNVAHVGSEVIFDTLNGPQKGQVSSGSQKMITDAGAAAYIGCDILGTRLKDGKIIGGCSGKVICNG